MNGVPADLHTGGISGFLSCRPRPGGVGGEPSLFLCRYKVTLLRSTTISTGDTVPSSPSKASLRTVYVFFITGASQGDLLAGASCVATLPGVPGGTIAAVSTEEAEELGLGPRVALPLPAL